MSVALRTITRLQDADDINVSLGVGVDEYALVYDHDTAKFVLRAMSAGVTDHGALTGLADDDHTQYLLATGARTGASSQAQTFTNGIIGPTWKPASDSTTALQMQKANGTAIVNIDTTSSRVGIGTTTPYVQLDIGGGNWAAASAFQVSGASAQTTFGYDYPAFFLINTNTTNNNYVGFMFDDSANPANQYGASGIFNQFTAHSGAAVRGNLVFGTRGNDGFGERMRITSDGKVGIGRTPEAKLDIAGQDYTTGSALQVSGASASTSIINDYASIMLVNTNQTAGNYNSILFSDTATVASQWGAAGIFCQYTTHAQIAAIRADLSFVTRSSDGFLQRLMVKSDGAIGIGLTAPDSRLHVQLDDAATNAASQLLTLSHNTSGTAAAGFGSSVLFELETSTTADQSAAAIKALWNDATHASRKADLVLSAFDTSEREGIRIRGAGSAAAIGFLGATPAARQSHVADPSGGATVDTQARSAINSILATLETFGFHATS